MGLPLPQPGLVIRYAYLWRSEEQQGRDEGVKDRPCVIVLSARPVGADQIVTVAPVTHTPPPEAEGAVEIPLATKRRLGLDDERSWVITTEVNRFMWPGPDLRPIRRGRPVELAYGFLPRALFEQVKASMVKHIQSHRMKRVQRD